MMESDGASIRGNVPQYSVSEISGAIKRTLESGFGRVRVRGEITELKRYPSGHIYLSLKDEGGKIAGVIWRGSVSRLGMAPENGNEVIATGRVSAYGERSSYQLVIDRMEFAGEGALLANIERLRRKLLEEGLFDPERKKAIPFLPSLVGVVTSRSGAVLHDIITTISRRFPRDVLLWPVPVQGEGAAAQIAAAIEGMSVRRPRTPDVLIVARGGGSLEDLMAFNDERVLRAVAVCPVPIISAVGHETDTTLIDLVSDRRAPTPTAAAEMAVPLRSEMVADMAHRNARLTGALTRIIQTARARLDQAAARLPDLPGLLDSARMRLEDRGQRLDLALPSFVMRVRHRLDAPGMHLPSPELLIGRSQARLQALRLPAPELLVSRARARLNAPTTHLPNPELLIERRRAALQMVSGGLDASWQRSLQTFHLRTERQRLSPDVLRSAIRLQQARLQGVGSHLEAVSPRAILSRGYVLVQDMNGQPVTSAEARPVADRVVLSFVDGDRGARLDSLSPQGDLGL
ncbi:exodeoxyribonuclease VII large subunit [Gluconobacter kondonii]|uniref:Exodeoxyribonuclease 7 large subunit n=1 Tax=Gluconobacter kondonii TaxID=941463 RepID=A0ABQ5WPF0_9PROT|nr:exodeoxyribonuclease VII large subunit [Gluconobacter kondonii]MCP1234992.1 exodeoxyribonuclease VII large subunit [Gluconobacter kondonii]GBR33218.1 exodeoxyribonuclease VII large subunit [Gluconobacter kondonii NBRC 3266]GLQ64820.1 exodeoxyribonuclease 7 large subunit [Gluconobacter kondonii]